jgi:alkylhydroperoxidase/carboxymuconolactone decarboxylase family protein YurZ
MAETDRHEVGVETWRKVLGSEPPPPGTSAFLDMSTDHLFGEVWSRGGLTMRERRLVTLTVMAMLGNPMPMELHVRAALESGDLTASDIEEFVIHLAHYGGQPVGTGIFVALAAVLASPPPDAATSA